VNGVCFAFVDEAPLDLEANIKTRKSFSRPALHKNDRVETWQPKPAASSLPATPPHRTVQTILADPQRWPHPRFV